MQQERISYYASQFTNKGFNMSREKFLEEMQGMHRTEQQIFAGLVLSWLQDYAKNYGIDDRNKCSVETCRTLVEAYEAQTGEPFKTKFPLI